jgi:hypothetical protein
MGVWEGQRCSPSITWRHGTSWVAGLRITIRHSVFPIMLEPELVVACQIVSIGYLYKSLKSVSERERVENIMRDLQLSLPIPPETRPARFGV